MRLLATAAAALLLGNTLLADVAKGQGFPSPTLLSRNESVQKELKLTPQQVKTLEELLDQHRAGMRELFLKTRRESPEGREKLREAARSLMTEYSKKFETLLQPEQAARLREINLQNRAQRNLIDTLQSQTVAGALALTDEQKKQLSGLKPPRRGRPAQLSSELKDQALALLTDAQRQKLDELMGKPFDLSQLRGGILGAPARGGFAGGNREEFAERIFKRIDTDGNGKVSKDEAAASGTPLRGNFDRFDVNSDGEVSLAEFRERFPISGSGQTAASVRRAASVFAYQDRDKDGKITKEEASYGPLKANFDRFDSDSDGGVTLEEFKASFGRVRPTPQQMAERFMSTYDKDGDGKVTRTELGARLVEGGILERMDANGDGVIDVEEIKRAAFRSRQSRELRKEPGLQGEWALVSMEMSGKKLDEDALKKRKTMLVNGSEWTGPGGGRFTLAIDPTRNPKQLDLRAKRAGKVRTWRGIYKIEGDNLTFCRSQGPDGERPKEFKGGTGVALIVFKRVTK